MKNRHMMTLLLIYLLMLLAVLLLQRKMMYFPDRFTSEQQEKLLAEAHVKPWPSDSELHGLIAKTPVRKAKGTVLVFHGNAGAAIHRTYFINGLQKLGYRVIIAEYPGYGTRTGSPSEAILIKDGIETAKMALREFKEDLILCGESLGSGVVAGILASHEVPVKGLLLITPFDSMTKVAHHHYWFFLAKWLLWDRYDNVARLSDFQGHVAVLMAEQDDVIPNQHTLALFNSLPGPKKLWRVKNANHNNLPMGATQPWWTEVMHFLDH